MTIGVILSGFCRTAEGVEGSIDSSPDKVGIRMTEKPYEDCSNIFNCHQFLYRIFK